MKLQLSLKDKNISCNIKQEESEEAGDNEKILLSEIEQIKRKISELEEKVKEKDSKHVNPDEHIIALQKRIEELTVDSKRYFEKYEASRDEHMRLLISLTMDQSHGIRYNREATARMNSAQRIQKNNAVERTKLYTKRLFEVTN